MKVQLLHGKLGKIISETPLKELFNIQRKGNKEDELREALKKGKAEGT